MSVITIDINIWPTSAMYQLICVMAAERKAILDRDSSTILSLILHHQMRRVGS